MVRPFPRTTRRALLRRPVVAMIALGVLATGIVPAVSSAANLEERKRDNQRNQAQAQERLDESSAAVREAAQKLLQAQADLAGARAYLAQTQTDLAAARARDASMQQKLDAAVVRLRNAKQDLRAGRKDVGGQEEELRRVVVSNYEQGDPGLMGLSTVFSTQDPAQLAGTMNTSSTVVNVQTALLDRLEAAKVLLTVREQETRAAKIDVAAKREAAAENLVRKQSLELQARQAESQVSQMVDLRTQAKNVAQRAKTKDLKQLADLQAEQDRIEALIAAQTSVGGAYTGPTTGNGFLDYPVPGPITSPFGWRIHPIFGYRSLHDGIDVAASCGTPIKATAPGKVIAAYYQTAWGNRIIIDNGRKYGVGVTTIVNHMSGYAVSAGDTVKRGQVIGYIGTTGWSTGCHTHFTVMENGSAVDPMKWF